MARMFLSPGVGTSIRLFLSVEEDGSAEEAHKVARWLSCWGGHDERMSDKHGLVFFGYEMPGDLAKALFDRMAHAGWEGCSPSHVLNMKYHNPAS